MLIAILKNKIQNAREFAIASFICLAGLGLLVGEVVQGDYTTINVVEMIAGTVLFAVSAYKIYKYYVRP